MCLFPERAKNNPKLYAFFIFHSSLLHMYIEVYVSTEHTRSNKVRHSIVASIPACHAGDRGSIPRDGILFLFTCTYCSIRKLVGPGFALGIRASKPNESNRSSMRALIFFSYPVNALTA